MAPAFDGQSHSTRSDGSLEPAEVVARAAAAGVEVLALTDHDTAEGVSEARGAGRREGVRVVPAVELTAVDGEHDELHVVAYEIDHEAPGLVDALVDLRTDRERRVLTMADRLEELGLALARDELDERRRAGLPLGRPHLARAVLGDPRNWQRLQAEGIAGAGGLFPAYLVPGAPGYVARERPTVAEAIALVHDHGGVAVWAHPFWDLADPIEVEATLRRFAAGGMDGVEAFYPAHDRAQTHLLDDLAGELGLLATAASDFHGPEHEHFSRFLAYDTFGRQPRLGDLAVGGWP
jgi:predicted metal-dependent phosphoesterase TrpH